MFRAASDFFIVIHIDFFKCNRTCLLQRSLRHICMHGRHGYGLVVIISRPEIAEVEEELQVPLEIFVQESIKDRVDTGGDHGCEVAEQEEQVVVAGSNDLVVPVEHSVEDGQGQPADREGNDNGKKHDVDAFGLAGPVLAVPHLVHHVVPPFQANINLWRKTG